MIYRGKYLQDFFLNILSRDELENIWFFKRKIFRKKPCKYWGIYPPLKVLTIIQRTRLLKNNQAKEPENQTKNKLKKQRQSRNMTHTPNALIVLGVSSRETLEACPVNQVYPFYTFSKLDLSGKYYLGSGVSDSKGKLGLLFGKLGLPRKYEAFLSWVSDSKGKLGLLFGKLGLPKSIAMGKSGLPRNYFQAFKIVFYIQTG